MQTHTLNNGLIVGLKEAKVVADVYSEVHGTPGLRIMLVNHHEAVSTRFLSTNNRLLPLRNDSMNLLFERDFTGYFHHPGKMQQISLQVSLDMLDAMVSSYDIVPDKQLQLFIAGQSFAPELRYLSLSPNARLVINQIERNAFQEPGLQRLFLEAKTLEWLSYILHELNQAKTAKNSASRLSSSDINRIYEARERLLANLNNPPKLAELAHAVSLNEKKLTQGFKDLFGMTVFAWVREQRLLKSVQLLQEGWLSIQDIASFCGYNYQSDFTTAFKARFGVTPAVFKKSPII